MLARYKEEFGRLMVEANLSDYEFVVLAKRLGLDDKPMGARAIAKLFGFDDGLVTTIFKRAVYKVKMSAEDQGEFEVLWSVLSTEAKLNLGVASGR